MDDKKYSPSIDPPISPRKATDDLDPYLPISYRNLFVKCSFCDKDITNSLRFHCEECKDIQLCQQCFMSGKENDVHKKSHPYSVNENLQKITLLEEGWSALDELKLLEAGFIFGMGDWEEASNYLIDKSEYNCLHHFFSVYIDNAVNYLPDISKGIAPFHADEVTPEKPVPEYRGPGCDIQGYWPYRGDFDYEYDNELEYSIKDLEITGEEEEKDLHYKLCLLRIFNRRLQDRNEKKKFIFDRDLLNIKHINAVEKKRSKEEKMIYAKIKPFCRFLTPDEFDVLANNLLKEEVLRQRIKELQRHRRNGIISLEQLYDYNNNQEQQMQQQQQQQQQLKTRSSDVPMNQQETTQVPMDLNSFDYYALLTDQEKTLCSNMHLLPKHYLAIKDSILYEILKNNKISKEQLAKKIQIDINQTKTLYDFYVSTSWVNNEELNSLTKNQHTQVVTPTTDSNKKETSMNHSTTISSSSLSKQPIQSLSYPLNNKYNNLVSGKQYSDSMTQDHPMDGTTTQPPTTNRLSLNKTYSSSLFTETMNRSPRPTTTVPNQQNSAEPSIPLPPQLTVPQIDSIPRTNTEPVNPSQFQPPSSESHSPTLSPSL